MRNSLSTRIIVHKRPKIWGKKINLFNIKNIILDVLFLKKNTFCSTHWHDKKSNTFILLSGCVYINIWKNGSVDEVELKCFVPYTVDTDIVHRFVVLKNSTMIEISAVSKGEVEEKDIHRISQGGKVLNGKEVSERYLRLTGEIK